MIANFLTQEKVIDAIFKLLSIEIKPAKTPLGEGGKALPKSQKESQAKKQMTFKFAIVSDSHNENELLGKALSQAQSEVENVKFIIGLGDYTEVGTIAELENAKGEFDKVGIRYFLTAGDHDLWDSRERQNDPKVNFVKVFGRSFQSFSFAETRFLILDNSDNYQGIGREQLQWLVQELERIKVEGPKLTFVFSHEPLYHPSSSRIMGKITPSLKKQAQDVLRKLKAGGVREVFAGDIHYFSSYQEPETGLSMTTVGAVASLRNAQLPRFVLVTVFDNGSYQVEDIEIK